MQQVHFDATDTPQDISSTYVSGEYLAQMQTVADGSAGVLYATATTPPADDADYFVANSINPLFQFSVSGTPTWVKTSHAGVTITLAVARLA